MNETRRLPGKFALVNNAAIRNYSALSDATRQEWESMLRVKVAELDTVISENRVDSVGPCVDELLQKCSGCQDSGTFLKAHKDKLRRAVDSYEQLEP